MDAFHSGRAETLVATDIAARGIHVDDVALVIHADPPVEHKAYLHRSGRTARAGARGTVVTLMTSEQVGDVRQLTRAAGIKPRTTRLDGAGHPVLTELAPGERVKVPGGLVVEGPPAPRNGGGSGSGRSRRRRGGGTDNRSGTANGKGGGSRNRGRSGKSGSGRRSGSTGQRSGSPARGGHSAASFSAGS
jgi:superfamily II DNA/RNA helicase